MTDEVAVLPIKVIVLILMLGLLCCIFCTGVLYFRYEIKAIFRRMYEIL